MDITTLKPGQICLPYNPYTSKGHIEVVNAMPHASFNDAVKGFVNCISKDAILTKQDGKPVGEPIGMFINQAWMLRNKTAQANTRGGAVAMVFIPEQCSAYGKDITFQYYMDILFRNVRRG